MNTLFLTFLLLLSSTAFAQGKKVAVVKILRGDVSVLTLGATTKLKAEDWVEDGATIKTSDKSFAKLVFIDKSQMNIGPNSEMKIQKFSETDAGVIDLVKGQIRSQVTKDYLKMDSKDKSKLFIKTPNAVMGIRGTDFMISTNGINTASVLFEGEVVFNKIDPSALGVTNSAKLEAMVDSGVRMFPGEFSVVNANRPEPTVPSILNVQQREKLEKNVNFEPADDRSPSSAAGPAKSVVPEGLSGTAVSNTSNTINSAVATVAGPPVASASQAAANPDGFVQGDTVKPANGAFVDIATGVIIPPAKGSVFDANTNSYVASASSGTVNASGAYVPPANTQITPDGKILVTTVGSDGKTQVNEVKPAAPVFVASAAVGGASTTTGPAPASTPTITITPYQPPLSGAPTNRSDFIQQGGVNTNIERLRTIHVGQ